MKNNKGRYALFARVCMMFVAIALLGFTGGSRVVNDFRLKNTDGRYLSLKDYPDAKGFIVVFTCNHCPFAKLYPQRLNELNKKYKPLGVPVIAISSSDTVNYEEDSYAAMVQKAREEHYNFPYLYDATQEAGRNFAAIKTPHAFIIWKEGDNWVVKYNGAIDDNGAEPAKVQHHYVADAVDALLKGEPVSNAQTKSIGCQIQYRNQ